ncbi:MAG: hypothetical protein JWR15_3044 [Prosthecobacter sp.]|nr:hypothetical protein [Prosthecobacter sp.]
MNTNHDPFENDLRALQRRKLPENWRDEMLQAAAKTPHGTRTPRWLVAGWSVAWAATLVLYFTTPAEPEASAPAGMSSPPAPLLWQERTAAIAALLAAN